MTLVMGVLPVIVRELRAQSRQPSTYWLRVGAAAALGGAWWLALRWLDEMAAMVGYGPGAPGPQLYGAFLFGRLNLGIFLTLWLLVPLLTADAISRERREGTLGLLFLTPLRPSGVVLGKVAVHILRALTLYLTLLPWLMVPAMLGGVGWRDVVMAALIDAGILIVALSAGLIATSWSDDWVKTALLAEIVSLVLGVTFLVANWKVFSCATFTPVPAAGPVVFMAGKASPFFLTYGSGLQPRGRLYEFWRLLGFATSSESAMANTVAGWTLQSGWGPIWATCRPAVQARWFAGTGVLLVGALAVLGVGTVIAARRVAVSWRDQPRSSREIHLRLTLFSPRFWQAAFRSRLARKLNRNPIGWLQERSAAARLVKWGWCAFAMLVVVGLAAEVADLRIGLIWLRWLLLLGLAFSASSSFRRERESGAFELLLVTPLSVDQIILGRLRGLWMQYLPASMVMMLAVGYLGSPASVSGAWRTEELTDPLLSFLFGFLALPTVGLFFSMRQFNFPAPWLATCALGIGVPWGALQVVAVGARALWEKTHSSNAIWLSNLSFRSPSLFALSLGISFVVWLLLRRQLLRRSFVWH